MATTTNYSFTLPTVGGSENEWGTNLNANWTALDTLLGGVTATEFGVLSGIPALTGNEGKAVAVAADGSALTYVDFPEGSVYLAGSGLTLSGSTFSHADTSTQASVNNSGNTFIQDISVDEFGHITAITSATSTATANDSTITIAAGTGLTGGGSFTTNQSFGETITLNATAQGIGIGQSWSSYATGQNSVSGTNATGTPYMVVVFQFGNLPTVTVGGIQIQDTVANASGAVAFIVPNGISWSVSFGGTPGYVRILS